MFSANLTSLRKRFERNSLLLVFYLHFQRLFWISLVELNTSWYTLIVLNCQAVSVTFVLYFLSIRSIWIAFLMALCLSCLKPGYSNPYSSFTSHAASCYLSTVFPSQVIDCILRFLVPSKSWNWKSELVLERSIATFCRLQLFLSLRGITAQ